MEVTNKNFETVADEIERLLPSAAFIAIDEEMTGIEISGVRFNFDDMLSKRYESMKKVASHYNIIQFGLCLFHSNPILSGQFIARPYNFYLFPQSGAINMEAKSMKFNKKNDMDFNKWIYEGIPYVNAATEEIFKTKYFTDPKEQIKKKKEVKAERKVDKEFLNKWMLEVEKWFQQTDQTASHLPQNENATPSTLGEIMGTYNAYQKFCLPACNSFLRLVLRQKLDSRYPNLIIECLPSGTPWKQILLLRLTKKEKEIYQKHRVNDNKKKYMEKIGFLRIFKAISSGGVCGKSPPPLIGHNCMYDLMFMMNSFHSLPTSVNDFKKEFCRLFPRTYDTKYLAECEDFKWKFISNTDTAMVTKKKENRFKHTSLSEVYKTIKSEPNSDIVVFAQGFERYQSNTETNKYHEAGYDAYITGFIFSNLQSIVLAKEVDSNVTIVDPITSGTITSTPTAIVSINNFLNIIPLARSSFLFNLSGEDFRKGRKKRKRSHEDSSNGSYNQQANPKKLKKAWNRNLKCNSGV